MADNDKTIKVDGKKVTFNNHVTKTTDGSVTLNTTFDMTACSFEQILKWAGANRLIAWRTSGVKKLTTKEASTKNNLVIDCSKGFEGYESEEAKRTKEALAKIKASGMSLEELEALAEAYKAKRATESEQEAHDSMDEGEEV